MLLLGLFLKKKLAPQTEVCCRGIQRYSQKPSITALSEEKPKCVIAEEME
jgi:hypothetical protein